MLIEQLHEVLPPTPAGEQASWVFEQLLAVASGADPPSDAEIAQQYTPAWLTEVPTNQAFFAELAPLVGSATAVSAERSRSDEARVIVELGDGGFRRFRLTVEDRPPHRIAFQLFARALDPAQSLSRVVNRNGRSVHLRDYGGEGLVLLLWHGSGCDATVWESMVPRLPSFRVLAQDLPGHGASPLPELSVTDAIADAEALLDELDVNDPVVVGHSLGGWIALHFAATTDRCRALVCLDGPTALAYDEMGLTPSHPGFVPDPPDVIADLDALECPTLVTLCAGMSASETEWMVPFRRGIADYITRSQRQARVKWQPTGHMMVLTHPEATADLIEEFVEPFA